MTDGALIRPAARFEWERLVRRIVMPSPVKLVAFVLATYADVNGTRVRPGHDVVAAVTGYSERNVIRKFNTLKEMSLIELVRKGGGRGGKGKASEYRLTIPIDLLDRFAMLPPGDRGPVGLPVDNSESSDTQASPHSADVTANQVTPRASFERFKCQIWPIEVTQLCPTTRPDQPQQRPDQRGSVHSPPHHTRAQAAAPTPTPIPAEFDASEFEAAS